MRQDVFVPQVITRKARMRPQAPVVGAGAYTVVLVVRSLGYRARLSCARQLSLQESRQVRARHALQVWTVR
jgi:hypothetical protein